MDMEQIRKDLFILLLPACICLATLLRDSCNIPFGLASMPSIQTGIKGALHPRDLNSSTYKELRREPVATSLLPSFIFT